MLRAPLVAATLAPCFRALVVALTVAARCASVLRARAAAVARGSALGARAAAVARGSALGAPAAVVARGSALGARAAPVTRAFRALVVAVALSLVAASAAWADGDPAGDVLIQQNVFYGSALDLRSKEAAQLMALTEEAKEKGYEIRVAALTVPEDLGAIGYLWDDPTNYADFLTAEIQSVYRERTLVVMPSGLGIWWRDHEVADEQALLDELGGPGQDASAVMPLAMEAIIKLAAAQDVELTIPDVEPPPGGVTQPTSHYEQNASAPAEAGSTASANSDTSWLFALPALLVVLAAGFILVRKRLSSSA